MTEPTTGRTTGPTPGPTTGDAANRPAQIEQELDRTDLLLSQHRASVRAALVEASAAFERSPEERGAAIDLVVRALADDLAAAFVVVYRYEPSPEGVRRWATRGWCHVDPGDYSRFTGVLVQNSESARRVASGEIMRADRTNWTPFDFAYVASLGARVGVVAPIAADGHLYGELRLGLRHTRDLESDEIEMLRAATATIYRLATFAPRLAGNTPTVFVGRSQRRPAPGSADTTRRGSDALRDFGNLITAIVGYAELLRARTGADEATHILSAARRAATLTSHLLTSPPLGSASGPEPAPPASATTPAAPTTESASTTTATTPAAAATPATAAGTNDPTADRKIVVLLVEDEDIVRAFTTRALERRGFEVLVAATPAEALAFANDGRHIDVLVSDVVMPGMSGPELAERFRALHANAGIVLTSGYPSGHVLPGGQVLAPGEATGPNDIDFLGKPFEASTLVATIRANLARRGIGSGPDR